MSWFTDKIEVLAGELAAEKRVKQLVIKERHEMFDRLLYRAEKAEFRVAQLEEALRKILEVEHLRSGAACTESEVLAGDALTSSPSALSEVLRAACALVDRLRNGKAAMDTEEALIEAVRKYEEESVTTGRRARIQGVRPPPWSRWLRSPPAAGKE